MLTAAIDKIATSSVGTMIRLRFSTRARPSACKSRSPASVAGAGLAATGLVTTGFATTGVAATGVEAAGSRAPIARWTTSPTLPARQNAKRIAHSRGRHCYIDPGDYTPLRLRLG